GLRAFGAQRERAAAYDLSMVLDGNGDPAMAFIFYDPNADSVPIDTRIEFRSWNRAV
ncbi:MAG: Fibronectin, type domain protein, partial [Candidatus Solibacter sp.]|nr:Fibronectin, type domain protein [Candidatus Solibacter sp.]